MHQRQTLRIAVLPGDGIGGEIMPGCLALLAEATASAATFALAFEHLEARSAAAKTSSGKASPVR